MLIPGPSSTATSWSMHSSPSASPTRRTSSRSHEAARPAAVGKHVAGVDSAMYPAFASSSLRTPCGPSLTSALGTPTRSTSFVRQKPSPDVRRTFSCSDMFATARSASAANALGCAACRSAAASAAPMPTRTSLGEVSASGDAQELCGASRPLPSSARFGLLLGESWADG